MFFYQQINVSLESGINEPNLFVCAYSFQSISLLLFQTTEIKKDKQDCQLKTKKERLKGQEA